MTAGVYARSTSVPQGDSLAFRFTGDLPGDTVTVTDTVRGDTVFTGDVPTGGPRAGTSREWTLPVPGCWPSSLYRACFDPGGEVYFVVRPAVPGSTAPILVVAPFLTWQAYNRLGVPGEGLYLAEQPDRAMRVSFDRPGTGTAGRWEARFNRWLGSSGYPVEFCSGVDLHSGQAALDAYRLLVVQGHHEYWTAEMRDAVEAFTDGGGNVAFLAGNTCWWQVRLEDDLRTLACHRDAVRDPVSTRDPGRTTVEWSSAPVNRPENTMTGVSFRHGAGCWEDHGVMASQGYTVRFADHWAFDGTGLRQGETFAAGAVGYETDAADFTDVDGVPRVTGRDGTPASFVILATADLSHWRRYGQGGHATMGVFQRGRGTVFNAATINWGNRIDDPVVERITRNVLDRLTGTGPRWEPIGSTEGAVTLVACENLLFGASEGRLQVRECCGQNMRWRTVGDEPAPVLLTAPRESDAGHPVGLYGLFADGMVRYRDPVTGPAPWQDLCAAPAGTRAFALSYKGLFAATDGRLWRLPLTSLRDGREWTEVGPAPDLVAMAGMNGRLLALTSGGRLVTRLPTAAGEPWQDLGARLGGDLGDAPGMTMLAANAGWLITGTPGGRLYRRPVTGPVGPAHRPAHT